MELLKEDIERSDRLIKNISDDSWDTLKELAKYNGVTISRMIELLIENLAG